MKQKERNAHIELMLLGNRNITVAQVARKLKVIERGILNGSIC